MAGSTAFFRQSADGTGSSWPSASRTFVIAIGLQYVPPEANVAYAAAMCSGDEFCVPRIIEGLMCTSPSSLIIDGVKPADFAVSATPHMSSLLAMVVYAVLTELYVALRTDIEPVPVPSGVAGVHCSSPTRPPPPWKAPPGRHA